MHARKLLAGLATAAVAVSGIALTAAPASAVYTKHELDPSFTPVSADLIGGGSDTTMGSVHYVAEAFNSAFPNAGFKVASYAAQPQPAAPAPANTISLPSTPTATVINRPNGSGGGKGLLYGANNQVELDFARSSSGLNDNEKAAGLRLYPFGLDTLRIAVSGSVASNAPASLTPAQIVDIYEGDITNWNQLPGGKAGVIAPKVPQGGSGTRDFFLAQLKAIKGSDVTLAGTVVEVQEHDDTTVKNNPNAVAPFSLGRAELLKGSLRLTSDAAGTGWKADRAVYNVVRQSSLTDPKVQAVFGEDGFFCSTAARPFIEQGGLKQLATEAKGGECGLPTQSSTSNFTLNQAVVTSVRLSVASTTARTAKLTAVVSGSTAPRGTVTFYDGAKVLRAGVALISGQATTTVAGLAPGNRSYRAEFVPAAGSVFEPSQATGAGRVKTSSVLKVVLPKKAAKAGKAVRGTATVTLAGVSAKATGTIKVTKGSKTIASGKLVNGKAKLTLKKGLKAGKNKLRVVWAGDANSVGSVKAVTVKVAKAKKKK